jgi:hypothetical protein
MAYDVSRKMKSLLATSILFAISLQGFGLSIAFPQIKGDPRSRTGKTDNEAVQCILKEDESNDGAVSGELIVAKGFLDPNLGVNLAATDDKGKLVASWAISGREKDGKIHYYFALRSDLIKSATFAIFIKNKGMSEFHLRTVHIAN